MYLVFSGIAPLLFTPLANIYGRRPVYLFCALIAGITNVAAAYCTTWGGVVATHVFCGIAGGTTFAISPASIADIYYMHQREKWMGLFTVCLTNGAHLASLFGGFIAQYLDWQYCFSIPGYFQLGTFVMLLFSFPETLYTRNIGDHPIRSYTDLLLFKKMVIKGRRIKLLDFVRPLYMAKYLPILVACVYYMTGWAWFTVLFALTGAQLFTSIYHFETYQTGLLLSLPLVIGGVIGEGCAGWVTDRMVYQYAKHHNGHRKPESRIGALFLAILGPVGLIIQGICLSKKASWVGVAFGMAISNFGLQIGTTVTYSYCIDCYKPQSAEVSALINFFRQCFSCLVSFYAIPFGEAIQFQFAWLTLALINVILWALFLSVMIWGEKIRHKAWQAPPTFHKDL